MILDAVSELFETLDNGIKAYNTMTTIIKDKGSIKNISNENKVFRVPAKQLAFYVNSGGDINDLL